MKCHMNILVTDDCEVYTMSIISSSRLGVGILSSIVVTLRISICHSDMPVQCIRYLEMAVSGPSWGDYPG